MDAALATRVASLLGSEVETWERRAAAWQPPEGVAGGTQRYRVTLAGGERVFVKHATGGAMARWLRRELQVYAHLHGAFMPQVLAVDDGGDDGPLLVLEDLSGAGWPPPWTDAAVGAVLEALDGVHRAPPPPETPTLIAHAASIATGWQRVAADPEPFLALGLVSRDWLEHTLPALVAASAEAPLDGSSLLHLDVRSDNLCLRGDGAVLVDWNHACLGNGAFDVAFWLPSLVVEGGPEPHELLPGAGALTAVVSGYFAAVAGLPPPTFAPTVRPLQLAQLVPALAWARRELAL